MKNQKTCPTLEKLEKLVSKARPDLPKRINSFRPSRDGLTMGLWGILATLVRHADAVRHIRGAPEGKTIGDLIQPIGHHLLNRGYRPEDLRILEKFLVGKKRRLPFGTIAVDVNGIVTSLEAKQIKLPKLPKGHQPARVRQDIVDAINKEMEEMQRKWKKGED